MACGFARATSRTIAARVSADVSEKAEVDLVVQVALSDALESFLAGSSG